MIIPLYGNRLVKYYSTGEGKYVSLTGIKRQVFYLIKFSDAIAGFFTVSVGTHLFLGRV